MNADAKLTPYPSPTRLPAPSTTATQAYEILCGARAPPPRGSRLRPLRTDADEEDEDDEDVDDGDDGEGEGRDDLAEGLEAAEEADDAEGAEDADEAGGLVGHDDGEEGHDDDEGVQPRPAVPRMPLNFAMALACADFRVVTAAPPIENESRSSA